MSNMIVAPVGTGMLVSVLSDMCENKNAYKHCGLTPPHFVVTLDAGNGQTTIVRYIADVMQRNNIRRFGGLDQYLEYRLDGSLTNIKQIISDVRTCAVYTNHYEGVIAIDICALAPHVNEQGEYFVSEIAKISEFATLVFFVGSKPNRGTLLLVEKLKKVIPGVMEIDMVPYTSEELAKIALREIDDRGVIVEDCSEITDVLKMVLEDRNCKVVKDVIHVVECIIKVADFTGYSARLTVEKIKELVDWDRKCGESR